MVAFKELRILARPQHYLKNGFVWLPAFFGHRLTDPAPMAATFWAFIVFCLTASAIYIINDLRDVAEDRQHPLKKERPLAKRSVTTGQAIFCAGSLLTMALLGSLAFIDTGFLPIIGAYFILNLAYTFHLKHLAVIDVLCIAIGFVLRVYGGAQAASVPVSHWIIIMTFLLALFLALAKRRDDLLLVGDHSVTLRKSLDGYNLEFIAQSMTIMTSVIIIAYILYTVSPEIAAKHGTGNLYTTALWVICGLLRYLQIVVVKQRCGAPITVLLSDRLLWLIIACWLVNFYWLLYGS